MPKSKMLGASPQTTSSAPSLLSGAETATATVGLDVIVNRADGSLAFHGKTDADSRLEVRVPENGSVSLLNTRYMREDATFKVVTSRSVRTWLAPPDGSIETRWLSYQSAGAASSARFRELPAELSEYAPQGGVWLEDPSVEHRHIVGRMGLAACEDAPEGDEALSWSAPDSPDQVIEARHNPGRNSRTAPQRAQGDTMYEGRGLRASWLAFSLGSAAAAMACGDSRGNADQDTELEDAGAPAPDADVDAKVPLPDAGEEADVSQAPTLEGTLAIVEADSVLAGTKTRTPKVGLDVIVNRADGTLAYHGQTGADGRLEVRVPEKGSVSLLKATHTRDEVSEKLTTLRSVDTWLAPPDGYVIRHEEEKAAPAVADNSPMELTLEGVDRSVVPAGTAKLPAFVSCFTVPVPLRHDSNLGLLAYAGCPGSDSYDAVVLAQNAAGETLAYAVLLDQPMKPGEKVRHALPPTNTTFAEMTFTLSPIVPGTDELTFSLSGSRSLIPDLLLNHTRTQRLLYGPFKESAVLQIPAGIADRFELVESLRVPSSSLNEDFSRVRSASSLPAPSTVSPSSLSRVASLSPIDVSVLSQPVIEFSLASTGSREGCVHTELSFSDAGSPAIQTTWNHFQAASATSAAGFPELPEAFAAFAPQTNGSMGEPSLTNRQVPGKTGLDACEVKDAAEVLSWSATRR